ncbi:hypothetical protein J2R62_16610 [Plesiomonas shigelloides]|uniref:Uncharacterized protein n=1 Tax=Plesiomonas shigelloides TaxID=703 RepID=A0A8I1W9P4_PLESH|nr:hypothetical protein [Plesiomonas shigelloides]MBO1109800.1 hypothetical protein [Plesiomonas shigelloides]
MSKSVAAYEQALVAVLSEVKARGLNLDDLLQKTSSGIMGNASYTWVGAEYKTEVLGILESAVQQVK